MKIPISDQFLWDAYNVLEEIREITYPLFHRRAGYPMLPAQINPVVEKYRRIRNKKQFNKLIYYLKVNNYIRVNNLKGKQAIALTDKGIDKALKAHFKIEGNQERKKRKDKKWIMLIFDVPEKYKKSRELLRSILQRLGYKLFQQSVWVTPYDVSEKTEELLQFYNLDEFVRIFLVEEVE